MPKNKIEVHLFSGSFSTSDDSEWQAVRNAEQQQQMKLRSSYQKVSVELCEW